MISVFNTYSILERSIYYTVLDMPYADWAKRWANRLIDALKLRYEA